MDLKFYLNKIAKFDNIEQYSYGTVLEMKKLYEDYIDKTQGFDPDYPTLNFGGKGERIDIGGGDRSFYEEMNDIFKTDGLSSLL